jgi:hypothetical protein
LLVIGGGLALLRRRPKRAGIAGLRGVDIPEPDSERPRGPDMICPACRRGYPPGTARCAHDQTALVPYGDFAAGKGPGGHENVCPTCGEHYPAHVKFCGKDGTTLESTG